MFFTCTSTEAKCIALSQNTSLDMQMFGFGRPVSKFKWSIWIPTRIDLKTLNDDDELNRWDAATVQGQKVYEQK